MAGDVEKEGAQGVEAMGWECQESRDRTWTVAGCQRQHVREGSKIGEGEERGLRWGWDGPATSIP